MFQKICVVWLAQALCNLLTLKRVIIVMHLFASMKLNRKSIGCLLTVASVIIYLRRVMITDV